jgi:hypothetical protein
MGSDLEKGESSDEVRRRRGVRKKAAQESTRVVDSDV